MVCNKIWDFPYIDKGIVPTMKIQRENREAVDFVANNKTVGVAAHATHMLLGGT
jgi:hypothetical protein